jgi:hypothetical protein
MEVGGSIVGRGLLHDFQGSGFVIRMRGVVVFRDDTAIRTDGLRDARLVRHSGRQRLRQWKTCNPFTQDEVARMRVRIGRIAINPPVWRFRQREASCKVLPVFPV